MPKKQMLGRLMPSTRRPPCRATLNFYMDMDETVAGWRDFMLPFFPEANNDIDWLNQHPNRDKLIREVYAQHPEAWLQLKPLEDGIALVDWIIGRGHNMKWLTAVGVIFPCFHEASRQKKEWTRIHVDEVLGIDTSGRFIAVEDSHLKYHIDCFPDGILVDDFHKNIQQWKTTGREAIHFYGEDRLAKAKEAIILMEQAKQTVIKLT